MPSVSAMMTHAWHAVHRLGNYHSCHLVAAECLWLFNACVTLTALFMYSQVRKEVEESELKECTFAPRTGRPPSPARVNPTVPAHERLYNQTPNHQRKRWAQQHSHVHTAHASRKPGASILAATPNTHYSPALCADISVELLYW